MLSKNIINSREEMEEILRKETMGFLGLCMDRIPYVVPLTYAYVEGRILFHCALKGKKLDYIMANPQVCFTVGKQFGEVCDHPQGARCRASHDSVICYGTARVIENMEERWEVLNQFNRSLQPDAEEIALGAISKCCAVEIRITEMTGRKQQKGMEWTHWEYDFDL